MIGVKRQAVDLRHRTTLTLRELPPILMYHNVDEVEDDPHSICVSPQRFAEQMAWLARHGWRGVSVAELVDAMREGRHQSLVGITFDDGYVGVLHHAAPVLARHRFSATAFIVTDLLGGCNDWDEGPSWRLLDAAGVKAVAAAGLEVGSHSATHRPLTQCRSAELEDETAGSKRALSELLEEDVRGFAYPYGAMDARAREAVRGAGFEYACAVESSSRSRGSMGLPRIYVGDRDGERRFAVKMRTYRARIMMKGRRA